MDALGTSAVNPLGSMTVARPRKKGSGRTFAPTRGEKPAGDGDDGAAGLTADAPKVGGIFVELGDRVAV